jgi:hypothetical protein
MFVDDVQNSLLDPLYKRKYLNMENVPSAKLIWQPRLTKPSPQSNSMLFKVYSPGDQIRIIWMIPKREMWDEYKKKNLTESQIVVESIQLFENNPKLLASKEDDDLSEEKANEIYKQISINAKRKT